MPNPNWTKINLRSNRPSLVHAFFRGDPISDKIANAVRSYIMQLEKENQEWKKHHIKHGDNL